MSPRCILGVDPGVAGALAFFNPDDGELVTADMPVFEIKGRRIVDEYGLARTVDLWAPMLREVWLEQVGVRPGEGAVGAFSFGRSYGVVRGVCAANFITIHDVTPQKWKGALKVSADKDAARARASALLPRHSGLWPLKGHHGRAEAALIALYGSQQSDARAA